MDIDETAFNFLKNYCHQNFISFDVRSFLTKLLQFASSFFHKIVFLVENLF